MKSISQYLNDLGIFYQHLNGSCYNTIIIDRSINIEEEVVFEDENNKPCYLEVHGYLTLANNIIMKGKIKANNMVMEYPRIKLPEEVIVVNNCFIREVCSLENGKVVVLKSLFIDNSCELESINGFYFNCVYANRSKLKEFPTICQSINIEYVNKLYRLYSDEISNFYLNNKNHYPQALELCGSNIRRLPEKLYANYCLVSNTKIDKLPEVVSVFNYLDITGTNIKSLDCEIQMGWILFKKVKRDEKIDVQSLLPNKDFSILVKRIDNGFEFYYTNDFYACTTTIVDVYEDVYKVVCIGKEDIQKMDSLLQEMMKYLDSVIYPIEEENYGEKSFYLDGFIQVNKD